jgi:transposase
MEMKRKVKRYSKEMIHQIVQEVESGASRKGICEKYGIGLSTLEAWLPQYASKEFLATTKPLFTDQQRRTIIRNVTEGRMTIEEAQVAYRIKGRDTIKKWIRESKRDNPDLGLNPSLMYPSSDVIQERLQKAITECQLKILTLETLIDVAEQEFKIKIRKKSGAKQ